VGVRPLLKPVWQAAHQGHIRIVTSQISLLETLVKPYQTGDAALQAAYEQVLSHPILDLAPITSDILRHAARFEHQLACGHRMRFTPPPP